MNINVSNIFYSNMFKNTKTYGYKIHTIKYVRNKFFKLLIFPNYTFQI